MKKSLIITLAVFITMFIVVGLWYVVSPLFVNTVVDEAIQLDDSSQTILSSQFVDGDSFHKVSGVVSLSQSNTQRVLRFEDFDATNGPDLKVYLATDKTASDYVNLGDLKGNIGNQNYDIPLSVDIESYDTVLIWCEQFGVLFGSAELS